MSNNVKPVIKLTIFRRMKEIREFLASAEAGGSEHNPKTIAQAKEELDMLKAAAEEDYIKNKGVHCPHCGSSSLSGGGLQADGGEVWQEITCENCDEQWNDIYQLKGIEKIK